MDYLYAPWREEYILGSKAGECIFCEVETRAGISELILHRGVGCFILLNRYPYNSGHLMVIPYRHVARLEALEEAERNELMALAALASQVMTDLLKPNGINMGMNLGRAAGAGIDGHLHAHLVPRWVGDTNFMPAIFGTRIASVDLEKVCQRLRTAFESAAPDQSRTQ